MAELRKAALLAAHNFQKWPVNPSGVRGVFCWSWPTSTGWCPRWGDFCAQGGYTVGPWVFPFLMAEPLLPADGDAGADTPAVRCTLYRKRPPRPAAALRPAGTWTAGQVLYIAGTSAVYFAVVYLLTVLVLLPHVGFEPGWGKVIHTFCQTRMAGQHGIVLPFDHQISNALGPVEANLLELLLVLASGGAAGAGALCAEPDGKPQRRGPSARRHWPSSPCLWSGPAGGCTTSPRFPGRPFRWVDLTGTTAFPSLGYALAVLAGGERAAGPAGLSGHGAPGHRRVKICVKGGGGMDAIISLREVTKRFRETVALDKVTVDFEAGKIHGDCGAQRLGENGADEVRVRADAPGRWGDFGAEPAGGKGRGHPPGDRGPSSRRRGFCPTSAATEI